MPKKKKNDDGNFEPKREKKEKEIHLYHRHRRQTSGCSGCRCTHCFFGLVVLNKSRILLDKSWILILHPHFSGPFGANEVTHIIVKKIRQKIGIDFHENSRIFWCYICKMTWRVFQFLKCPPFALPLFDPWDCWKYVCFSIAEFQAHSYLMAIWL